MKTALIVDDNFSNRYLLQALLKKQGYLIQEAENGLQAVERYLQKKADIIFMDLMMPVMDGIEACEQIKALCGNTTFVPIIFVTAVTDEDRLNACIEAGGDDFITKPVDLKVLTAKIKSMERLIRLYDSYFTLAEQIQRDQEIAKKVFNSVVVCDTLLQNNIKTLFKSAQVFSGDMFLSALSPAGELHLMLVDFTGHGLGAALGSIPTSDVFKAMTAKGFAGDKILEVINLKLKKILPIGMFMAAQYVIIPHELDFISVCICGMPDVFIRCGQKQQIKYTLKSTTFPLGISSEINFKNFFEKIPINKGDSIILASDGVIEAVNAQHEFFGQARLEAILNQQNCERIVETMDTALQQFCEHQPQNDDISLVEIVLEESLFDNDLYHTEDNLAHEYLLPPTLISPNANPMAHIVFKPKWHWKYGLTLKAQELLKINPVPILINQLHEIYPKLTDNLQPLYTILTELYINALDHGILKLDSQLKNSPHGFESYFCEREKRLNQLKEGEIEFLFKGLQEGSHSMIKITIKDSGDGFDVHKVLGKIQPLAENMSFHGRGIFLVNSLCHSLIYSEPGNKVDAIFIWNKLASPTELKVLSDESHLS